MLLVLCLELGVLFLTDFLLFESLGLLGLPFLHLGWILNQGITLDVDGASVQFIQEL